MISITRTYLYEQLKDLYGEENLHLALCFQDQQQQYMYIPVKSGLDVQGWIGITHESLTEETKQLLQLFSQSAEVMFPQVSEEELFWQKAIHEEMLSWQERWTYFAAELPYPPDTTFGQVYVVHDIANELWNVELYEQFTELIQGVIEEPNYLVQLSEGQFIWILPHYDTFKQDMEDLLKGLVDTLASELMLNIRFFIAEDFHMPTELKDMILFNQKVVQACEQVRFRKNVIYIRDMLHLHLLQQSPVAVRQEYVQRVLGSVQHDTEVLETAQVFFQENLNISETAKKLYIHRNSMQYRLDKFFEKTRFDLRQFEQAVKVYIALQALGMLNKE